MHPANPIVELCAAWNVTRRCHHGWLGRVLGPRAQTNAEVLPLIEQAHLQTQSADLRQSARLEMVAPAWA